MRTPQLPVEYLVRASKETLESFELTRLNRAANFRKEARDVLNDWVQAEVESRLARFVLERRRAQSGDASSLSSENVSPLELDVLSSAAHFAQSVAEAHLNSFADPIGNSSTGEGTNCSANVFSVVPPASSPTTQLSFRESLLAAHFQFELFAGAPGAIACVNSNAAEEVHLANATSVSVQLAKLSSGPLPLPKPLTRKMRRRAAPHFGLRTTAFHNRIS